jgi:hypothetical protein
MDCVTGKHTHASKGAAEAHVRSLLKRGEYEGRPYPCVRCHQWHVGRAKKGGRKNKPASPGIWFNNAS